MAIVAKKIQESKVNAIDELKTVFKEAPDYIFADYRGLTVEQISNLRKLLRAKGASFKVVKNNFARLAFEQLSTPDVSEYLIGPTAIAISPEDSNTIAKILFDFAKETPALKVKGGLVGPVVYNASQIEDFSKLPGRLELISMLMSCMNGPLRNLVSALNDIPSRLVRTVKAVADQKAGGA